MPPGSGIVQWLRASAAIVNGAPLTHHSGFAFVFRVRNGKLTAFRAYHDTDAMVRTTAAR
jgi:ketosteroid isomerase-like protein